jgi:hypothetical protein
MVKDCRSVIFPVILDMIPYVVQTESHYRYQLVALISHLGHPGKDQGYYMTFLRTFGQWIRVNDTQFEAVEGSAALHEKLPRNRAIPSNCHYPALCNSKQSLNQILFLIMSIVISQLTNRSHR